MHVVGGDLHGDDLVGVDPHREVELHVPLLLAVLPLYPASRLLDLYAGGVDGDAYGLGGVFEVLVGVSWLAEDPFAEAGVFAVRAPMRTFSGHTESAKVDSPISADHQTPSSPYS